jgi:hypothetical protein
VAIEATPAFLGGLGQLENHGERAVERNQPQPVDRLDQAILAFAAKWSIRTPPTNRPAKQPSSLSILRVARSRTASRRQRTDPNAVAYGRKGGQIGGKARAESLPALRASMRLLRNWRACLNTRRASKSGSRLSRKSSTVPTGSRRSRSWAMARARRDSWR